MLCSKDRTLNLATLLNMKKDKLKSSTNISKLAVKKQSKWYCYSLPHGPISRYFPSGKKYINVTQSTNVLYFILLKYLLFNEMWSCTSVIPTIQEPDVGGSQIQV